MKAILDFLGVCGGVGEMGPLAHSWYLDKWRFCLVQMGSVSKWSLTSSCATCVAPWVYVSLWQLRNLHPQFPPTLSTLSPGEQGQSHLPTQIHLFHLCHFRAWGRGGVGETSKHLGQNRRVRVRMKSCLRSECWASAIPRSGKPSLIMTKTSGKCAYQKAREGGARKSTLRHRHRLGQGVQEAELTTVQPKRQSTPGRTLS